MTEKRVSCRKEMYVIGGNQPMFFQQLSVSKGFRVADILWRKYSIEYSNFGFKLPLFHARKL